MQTLSGLQWMVMPELFISFLEETVLLLLFYKVAEEAEEDPSTFGVS